MDNLPINNTVVDPLEAILEAHKRMDEIEKEMLPLRNKIHMLSSEWERLGREASYQFNKMIGNRNG